jgi:hypothetical protein
MADAVVESTRMQAERVATIDFDPDCAVEANVFTLADATMVWNTGDGLRLKTIRLSLDAIAAWWVAKGEAIKGPKDSSGFWVVGVTF